MEINVFYIFVFCECENIFKDLKKKKISHFEAEKVFIQNLKL